MQNIRGTVITSGLISEMCLDFSLTLLEKSRMNFSIFKTF